MEVCALGMGQRSNDAAAMDAQKWLIQEDCALGTVQYGQSVNYAAVKDAHTLLSTEECA